MTNVGCEFQGLYYFSLSFKTCSNANSPPTIHAQLVHPSFHKLQKLVSSLSKLSNLQCESYQLGKHICSHFLNRDNNKLYPCFALVHLDV